MSHISEIKSKISSIKNIRKITSAMEMVAVSKMRKTQNRMRASRPYAARITKVLQHLLCAHSEVQHSFMLPREVKSVAYLVVSTDRGLCGSLNMQLFKQVLVSMMGHDKADQKVQVVAVGGKAKQFFNRIGCEVAIDVEHLGEDATVTQLTGIIRFVTKLYLQGKVDKVYLAYNEYINTMKQEPVMHELLPISPEPETDLSQHYLYAYEPEPQVLLDVLLQRYVESLIYQGLVENQASEQAARMVAMKTATDNAGELIKDLQLAYNKARQAAITQELTEIVAGAAAI